MLLADYQEQLVVKVYNSLINNEKIIYLKGSNGSGKTTVVKGISNQLIENWKVFYIRGFSKLSSPYLTFQSFDDNKLEYSSCESITNLSFGINFTPILPIYCEGNISSEHKGIFNSTEKAIYEDLKRQICGEENILIIADDIEFWDEPSICLLHKIFSTSEHLFPNKELHILITYSQITSLVEELFFQQERFIYSIPKIPKNDVLFILEKMDYDIPLKFDWNTVLSFAENNIYLIALCCKYCISNSCGVSSYPTLSLLLKEKLETMNQSGSFITQVLEPASILERKFTYQDITGLNSSDIWVNISGLKQAEAENFIEGVSYYKFVSDNIKLLFQQRISNQKTQLHYKFAYYLKERFPEDYLDRAYHLMCTQIKICYEEAAYLLCIEFCRRAYTIQSKGITNIRENLDKVLILLDDDYVKTNVQHFKEAVQLFQTTKYSESLDELRCMNILVR